MVIVFGREGFGFRVQGPGFLDSHVKVMVAIVRARFGSFPRTGDPNIDPKRHKML